MTYCGVRHRGTLDALETQIAEMVLEGCLGWRKLNMVQSYSYGLSGDRVWHEPSSEPGLDVVLGRVSLDCPQQR